MTDPTPESVEDALMNRLVALVDAWRANGAEPSAMALASIAGIVRKNMPPACDCDGGLFGAGPGDHAIGCPARPPEAPGERRPVAGWRACASRGEKIVAWELRIAPRAKVQEWHAMTLEVSMLHGGRFTFQITDLDGDSLVKAYPDGGAPFDTLAAAQLAAEDAADALLLAGRRALGRE